MYYRPQTRPIQRKSQIQQFPAPIAGWVANRNIFSNPPSGQQGAVVLDNILPTATGAVIRRGTGPYAQLGDGTQTTLSIFTYKNGGNRRLFAATETDIYDITTPNSPENYRIATDEGDEIITDTGDYIGQLSTDGLEVVQGLTGGKWVTTQFATTGGVFLIAVNGEDDMLIFDGTNWYPVNGEDIYQLQYTAETTPFTAGLTLTGGTSGATAVIVRVDDAGGGNGTLIITTLAGGPFTNGETITDTGGGSATASGTETLLFDGLTGVGFPGTDNMDYVWVYKNRLFFVEKDSMTAWYLPIDQIGGTVAPWELGGVFTLGGQLMFGSAWSLDTSGQGGLSEQCVFISDEGEVAVYQGKNPSDDNDWTKVGTYRTGKPLGPLAWVRNGGDLVMATDIGFIPLSTAIQRDFAALSPSAISYNIEDEWNKGVQLRRTADWNCIVWPEWQIAIVAPPTVNEQPPIVWPANSRTGAWTRFTNWNVTCMAVFEGRLFFGSEEGRVIEAFVTGYDMSAPYTAAYAPLFYDFGSPGARKIPQVIRLVSRGEFDVNAQLSVMEDYIVNLPSDPPAAFVPTGDVWGEGIWGTSTWGGEGEKQIQQAWTSVGGYGYALAPAMQVTSGAVRPLDTEIIRIDMTYTQADIVT